MLSLAEETPVQIRQIEKAGDNGHSSGLFLVSKQDKRKEPTSFVGDYGYMLFTFFSTSTNKEISERVEAEARDSRWKVVASTEQISTDEQGPIFDEAVIGAINDDRLRLLARKYATKDLPREDTARLAILQAKIAKTFPRVTASDFDRLDNLLNKAQSIREEDERIKERLAKL